MFAIRLFRFISLNHFCKTIRIIDSFRPLTDNEFASKSTKGRVVILFSKFIFLASIVFSAGVYIHAQDRTPDAARLDVKNSDTRVKILDKPRAAYPKQDGGTVCITGNVRLKVTFLSTGEIGAITPVTRLPDGLTENAIAAAEKIKFVPAMKDGKPVTSVATVDYSFTIY